MLGVVPFITDRGTVDLQIFPIVSDADISQTQEVDTDSYVTLPKVDVRNINTSAKVRDGDLIILGGLISRELRGDDTGIPFAQDIPTLGNLFKSTENRAEVTELVVLMQIRVVE